MTRTAGTCSRRTTSRYRFAAIASDHRGTHEANLAFDGDTSTSWWSRSNGALKRSAWVGIDLGAVPWAQSDADRVGVNIRCVRLYQDPDQDKVCSKIALEQNTGKGWYSVSQFEEIGYGGWVQRPPPLHSLYKMTTLYNISQPVFGGWRIYELEFFLDADCIVPAYAGSVPIGSRSKYFNPPPRAIDGNTLSYWEPDCEYDEWQICDTTGTFCEKYGACGVGKIYWGVDMSAGIGKKLGSTNALTTEWGGYQPTRKETADRIRCLRILQESVSGFTSFQMEKWNSVNNTWDFYKVRGTCVDNTWDF